MGYLYFSPQKQHCSVAVTAYFYFLVYALPGIPAGYERPTELHRQSNHIPLIP